MIYIYIYKFYINTHTNTKIYKILIKVFIHNITAENKKFFYSLY
jgi:hypothetical protein